MSPQALHDIRRKLRILNHAKESRNVSQTCRYFGISREIFYRWKRAYEKDGETALINSKPCPQNPKCRTPPHIEGKILHLRRTYHLGPRRIHWYLLRYHGIKVSSGAVYYVLKRDGLNRLPRNVRKRRVQPWQRHEKQVPGHHVQVDVKFLTFAGQAGKPVRRYQYTAIDDATRIRALKVYERHTQENAIDFVNYVVERFPFRIATIRTEDGHEFQSMFHWHVEDLGMSHAYIGVRTPRLNGKVERSHRTDEEEFYQLLTYTGDVDLNMKLEEWQNFYNYHRPHSAPAGNTPYEVLREKLNLNVAEAGVE
jgi:transposase